MKFLKVLEKIFDEIMFLLTGKGKVADEMVEMDLLDYSGQGRDKNGR